MEYIKEPEGIDFTVIPRTKPDPVADRLFSEFLAKEKFYETSRAFVSLPEPPSGYKREPWVDDLVAQISDITKEEAKEVSEFIRG